jgi:hypothetical protein
MIEPAATPGMNDQDPEQWFVTNGEWRMGPLAVEDVLEVLGRGHPPGSVHVWKQGQADWLPAEQVPEIAAARAGAAAPPRPFPAGPAPVAAPQAAVPAAPATPWFVVGSGKFLLMCLVTFGLYEIYWFYQQWRHVQRRGESVHPALRTLFAGLFCYGLFRRIQDTALERGVGRPVSPVLLTIVFLALSVTTRLPQPWSLLSVLSLVPLAVVQRTASAVALAQVPGADPNTRLSPLNWLAVVFTSLIVFLALLGLALGPAPDAPKPGTSAPAAQVRAI